MTPDQASFELIAITSAIAIGWFPARMAANRGYNFWLWWVGSALMLCVFIPLTLVMETIIYFNPDSGLDRARNPKKQLATPSEAEGIAISPLPNETIE